MYSATSNELIRALLQGDYSTTPWKTQLLRAVANNIQSEAHDFALQLGEQDITLEQMAELKDRAQQMDNIRIVLHDTRIDLDEFDTGVYPTEKDRSFQESLNMVDKLLATGFKRLSQVCTGTQRPVTTNLRYKHIEEYGLYQFHRGWLQEVFIVAGGHVGNEDISNFAKLWSDQIPPPTPFA